VTVDSQTHAVTRSGQYWAFAHYSKMIRRDAQVIASQGDLAGIEHVALLNPDGSRVLVLTNPGEEQQIQCQVDGESLALNLPAGSITTLVV
jgi:glucosylceramidase